MVLSSCCFDEDFQLHNMAEKGCSGCVHCLVGSVSINKSHALHTMPNRRIWFVHSLCVRLRKCGGLNWSVSPSLCLTRWNRLNVAALCDVSTLTIFHSHFNNCPCKPVTEFFVAETPHCGWFHPICFVMSEQQIKKLNKPVCVLATQSLGMTVQRTVVR